MKNRIVSLMLVLIGLVLTCISTRAGVSESFCVQDYVGIPLLQEKPPVDPNAPRSPALIPVSSSFDAQNGNLNFLFLFPMGDVTITLTEVSAGVVSTDDYSTSTCFVSIPVPGPGTYGISVLLESGTEYIGQFVNGF